MAFLLILLAGCNGESITVGSTEDIGKCICDITSSSCDQYCCCDSDCKASVITSWNGLCVVNAEVFDICSSTSSQSLEAGWRGMKVATDLVNRALCVQYDNSPASSNFYSVISSGSQTRAYNTTATSLSTMITQVDSTAISPGDYLFATGKTPYNYLWSLPTPDMYGLCTYAYPVKWMVSYPPTLCTWDFNPELDCANFDANYFSGSLSIATNSKLSTFISAKVRNVYKRKANAADSLLVASLSSSYSGGICTNALVEAHFYVYTESQTEVESVSVDIILSDISANTLTQSFSLTFITNTTGTVSKSGNPGYQIGKVLNTGYVESETNINYYESGFQVPGINADGSCGTGTPSSSPFLTFGQDLVSTCYIEYTYAELQNICNSSNSDLLNPSMFFNDDSLTLLGKYGNIDFSYLDDWVVVNNGTTFAVSSFDTASGVCKISNTLSYYITYADIGNTLNAQYKIIYAQRGFEGNTYWQFLKKDVTETQKFFFILTVNFIEYTKQIYSYFPPAPNPLPVMPDDILYPFKLSAASVLTIAWAIFY